MAYLRSVNYRAVSSVLCNARPARECRLRSPCGVLKFSGDGYSVATGWRVKLAIPPHSLARHFVALGQILPSVCLHKDCNSFL